MLIVSRKAGESILIGNDIEVFILDTQGDRVRVGIEAPKQVSIIRKELKTIRDENVKAVCKTELGNLKQLTVLLEKQNENTAKIKPKSTDI